MTVIAGGSRCNARYFSWHLMRTDRGQTVSVEEVVGLIGHDIKDWFEQMEILAEGGRTTNFFYHFSLSPRAGEDFTPEQEKAAVATALENLGLEDQPYFVIRHGGKDGRPDHYHCIALRVDLDTGKAISDSHNYDIHMRTATQLEKEFGHQLTERGRGPDGPNPKNYEVQRGRETNIDPKVVAQEARAFWRQSDNAQAFVAALEERGYILAKGDRGLCIVDQAGKEHSLYKRLDLRKKEVDPRMEEAVDRAALPTVEEARALARERAGARKERDDAPPQFHQDKRNAALEVVAEEIAEAVHDALKSKDKGKERLQDEPSPPKTDAGPAHAEENSSPGHAPPPDGPSPSDPPPSPEPEPSSAANTAASGLEEPPPARSSSPPGPAAAPQLSLFERLAETLSQAINALDGGMTVAEAADLGARRAPPSPDGVPLTPWEIPPPELRAPAATSTSFERLAQELVRDAQQAAPVIETLAVVAATIAEPELPEFQRVTSERFAAVQAAGGDDAFVGEGLRWLAQKTGLPGGEPTPSRVPTPFEQVTDDMFQAVRDNNGEPEPGYWRRGVALLEQARDRAAQWIRETSRTFAGRILRNRNTTNGKEQTGLER